eukprot:m.232287 g.232287  ORF g.232287 m.232287 type:complete len:81 (-) comp26054_c0_seq1:295-537(-)
MLSNQSGTVRHAPIVLRYVAVRDQLDSQPISLRPSMMIDGGVCFRVSIQVELPERYTFVLGASSIAVIGLDCIGRSAAAS